MILKDRCQPEPAMKLRPSVASVISKHVVFELESIDRVYLNVYVPRLQREGGVAAFFRFHRGHLFASSALMDPISKDFVARPDLDFASGVFPDPSARPASGRPRVITEGVIP